MKMYTAGQTKNPVIPSGNVHPDIPYALNRLYESTDKTEEN